MVQPVIVDVLPNKENITFNFMAIPNEKEAVSHLKWIADMVAEKGKESPQTIVFCNTFNDLSTILSYLLLVLKEKAFTDDHNGKRTSLLGVYHAKSWESQKVSIEEDCKSDGLKRIVIATGALGMGINFPRVWYVVQYGPPKSIVDLMQQAGRGGRNGIVRHTV
ncbi:Bloom syndrome protein homolog [Acropora millepora]|uniref:Bloom syndrome protein homolog n=1 Tax=Acropora millepora TaxID=45264 RepID=UPI001CF212A4|nr:Bloom syndrome protein homolog [Acropora millepora]